MPKENSAHLRRKARVLAFQALYEVDVTGHSADSSFGWLKVETELPEASSAYALELLGGVTSQRDEIDKFIHKFAPAWPVNQLALVDRNILRLALFEIRFSSGTPRKVAINEAVELAKTFGSESSHRFVNGVLGSVIDEVEEASTVPPGAPPTTSSNISQEGK
jgi:N utilization substance protein B